MLGLGVQEILLIAGGLILLFGAKKIPQLARGVGEGIRNFKGEMKGDSREDRPKLPEGERREGRREE